MIRRLGAAALVLALIAQGAATSPVSAAAGDLDTGFGIGGVVTADIGGDGLKDQATSLAIDATGRVVVAGFCFNGVDDEICVARFNSNGTPDTGFSGDGSVSTAVDSRHDRATAVAIDGQGNIVVGGECSNGLVNVEFCVLRYTATGALDTTFSSDGIAKTDINGDIRNDFATSMAIDPSGRIVLAGRCYSNSWQICALRYTSAGALDTSFGGDGTISTDIGSDGNGDRGQAVTVDHVGNILIAGDCHSDTIYRACLARYTSTGTLDTSFSGDGFISTDVRPGGTYSSFLSLVTEPNGSITVAGLCDSDFCIVRYTSDGALDTTFSGDGLIITDIHLDDVPNSVVIDAAGNVVVAGQCFNGSRWETCLARYTSTGLLDTRFGGDGVVTTDLGADGESDAIAQVVVGEDGALTVAGRCDNGSRFEFCIARYDASSPPTAPTEVSGTPGNGEIAVSWTAPASDGGNPVTSYTATAVPSGLTCTTPSTSCTIAGLTNGTTYSVSVTASNGLGTGPASSPPVAATPAAPPSAPTITGATGANGEATVAWTPPTSDGGAVITGYTVTASPGGRTCTTTSNTCTVSGLSNWTNHRFSVTASNAIGTGPASALSAVVVPGYAPGTPSNIELSAAGTLSWSVPDNGAPLSSHIIEYREVEIPRPPFATSAISASSTPGSLSAQIVGGEYPDIADHRYGMKLLAFGSSSALYDCGAVLIAPQWALTAAHCTEYQPTGTWWAEPAYIALVYGLSDWTSFTEANFDSHVAYSGTYYRHPDYDRTIAANDIALLRLDNPVDMSTADSIPLYELPGPSDATSAYVSGWGMTYTDGPSSDVLKGADVSIDASCGLWPSGDPVWNDLYYLCASAFPSGFCQGDSGGPLVVERDGVALLAGLVSFNSVYGCAISPAMPDVYTRVSTYVDWVEGHTGPLWSSTTVNAGAGSRSTTLAGLTPGKTYAVQIHTENAAGTGDAVVASFVIPTGPVIFGPKETGVDCRVPQPHPLTDIAATSFAANAVGCIYNLGITTGTSSTTYSPANNVTREQMAAFITRFYETVTGQSCGGSHPFTDVTADSFAADAIGCIFRLGITTGTTPTTYSPADSVTREQMAAFIARLYRTSTSRSCGSTPIFNDIGPGSFAYIDVGCIGALGVTTGTTATTYSPANNVTREQMAAFLARLYITMTS